MEQDAWQRDFVPDSLIQAPFNDMGEADMVEEVKKFISLTGLDRLAVPLFKGAFIAQDPDDTSRKRKDLWFSSSVACNYGKQWLIPGQTFEITDEEAKALSREKVTGWKRWKLPGSLWSLVILCGLGALIQGWDESAVNAAQVFYTPALLNQTCAKLLHPQPESDTHCPLPDPTSSILQGLINGAPYLSCVFSCWLTQPLNKAFGRRGTILFTCIVSAASAFAQAFSQNWQTMFVLRLVLGLGIGPKSATIPVYASESSPANVRGSLVMLWQVFTAIGILFGYLSGVVFSYIGNPLPTQCQQCSPIRLTKACSLNWRLMIGSPFVGPVILAQYVFTLPESPRWLLGKAHSHSSHDTSKARRYYKRAYDSFFHLHQNELLAARDIFLVHHQLLREDEVRQRYREANRQWWKSGVYELFSECRNRRAVTASLVTMFSQQFCGVNVIIYYSTTVFKCLTNYRSALWGSMGIGLINATFALPAFYTIDTFGRRSLLLTTIPLLSVFQFVTAIASYYRQFIVGIIGMYLFMVAYSPGQGPVPFVYSAESLPFYKRDLGMGLVTSINWFFNFLVAMTAPSMFNKWNVAGTFSWYGVWCMILWFLVFFLVPETKSLRLEELDKTFRQVRTKSFAVYSGRYALFYLRLRRNRPRLQITTDDFDHDHGYGYPLRAMTDPRYYRQGHHRLEHDSKERRNACAVEIQNGAIGREIDLG